MTITYTSKVATVKGFGVFVKLLFRWRGSIYKLVWLELLIYLTLYYALKLLYVFGLNSSQKGAFEVLVTYCKSYSDLIPLSFVLGFYVSIVMQRWWDQYKSIPWPDNLALFISSSVHGQDERARLMRRTIIRYVNMSFVMLFTMIAPSVKKRFPTLEHLVEAGLTLRNEALIIEKLDILHTLPKFSVPLVWASGIVSRARKEGKIKDDFAVKTIIDNISIFRQQLGSLLTFDRISIPLVYTQVVTLAVYSFFLSTLLGAQFIRDGKSEDFYVPWFNLLQFFFYMGWLKVAETMVNPFGEDDDDFEVNWLIDRHLKMSYLIVDEMHSEHPELIQDKYWDEIIPQDLPYTLATEHLKKGPHMGSTANLAIPRHEQYFLKPTIEEENEYEQDSDIGLTTPGQKRRNFVQDEEIGWCKNNFKRLHSTGKEGNDNESISGIWITPPSSLRRNSSILSSIVRQFQTSSSQRAHRILTRQRSHGLKSQHGSSQSMRMQQKQGSYSRFNRTDSALSKKDAPKAKMEDDDIFHLSLESLIEVDKEQSVENSISGDGTDFEKKDNHIINIKVGSAGENIMKSEK